MDEVLDDFEDRVIAGVILCGCSKEFDLVSREIMLFKLKHYHVAGKALSFFKSYLQGRNEYAQFH